MLNVGLFGAGRISVVHAAAITSHPHSALASVSDIDASAAQALADSHDTSARSIDEVLADPAINAVLIATSTNTHCDLIERATLAGKAVLCEKPVDLSLKRAQACLKHVERTGQPVMIGFNRRFDPSVTAVREALHAGEVGKAELLAITSFDPAPPPIAYIKVSGGLFRDMMIHDFDMVHSMMGEAPVTISAVGSSIVDPEIGAAGDVDTAVATLTFADGRIAVIKNSRRAAYGYDQRLEVLGSKGLLQVRNMLENTMVKSTAAGVTGAKPTYFFLERYTAAFSAQWTAFVGAVESGAAMPVSLADGVEALAMAEAATRSVQTGAAVALADVKG